MTNTYGNSRRAPTLTTAAALQAALESVMAMYDVPGAAAGVRVRGLADGDQITLLELANMSSGNADCVNEAFLVGWQAGPANIFTLDELDSGALGQPSEFEPGTKYVYTNANINLLGAVIEKVIGEPYVDVPQERILDPEVLESGALLKPETQKLREIGHKIAIPPYDLYAVGMGTTNGWWGHNGEGVGFTAATFYDSKTGASIVVYMNESDTADKSHPADEAFRALAAVLENGVSK